MSANARASKVKISARNANALRRSNCLSNEGGPKANPSKPGDAPPSNSVLGPFLSCFEPLCRYVSLLQSVRTLQNRATQQHTARKRTKNEPKMEPSGGRKRNV